MSGHARPIVAIPARFSRNASALRYEAEVSSRKLIEAVYAAGGDPVVLHPSAPAGVADVGEVRARVAFADAVLLPGGGDLAGQWSGQAEHPGLYDVDLEQDAFDLALATIALADGLPLLAICRGTQVVNVALGGTLVQEMEELSGDQRNHRNHVHTISVAPTVALASVIGERANVSCYHHQCVAMLGDGLEACAWSEDGVVEAVHLPAQASWFLGVQWHPEDSAATDPTQANVFRVFVEAARSQQ